MDWFDCTPTTLSLSLIQLVHIPFDSYVARVTTVMTNVTSNQSQAGGHVLLFLVSLRPTTSAFAVLIKACDRLCYIDMYTGMLILPSVS